MAELKIDMPYGPLFKPLDYEGVPFFCHMFHEYGHVISECPLPFNGKHKGSMYVTGSGRVSSGSWKGEVELSGSGR